MKAPLRTSLRILIASSMIVGTAFAQAPRKALVDVALTEDAVRLSASLANPDGAGSPAVWGALLASPSDQVAVPLPGLSILAQPSVLASGPLDGAGRLILKAARPAGGVYHLQAVMLHADLQLTASAVQTLDLSPASGEDDTGDDRPAVLDRVSIEAEVMESQPPRYAIVANFAADTDGYALVAQPLLKAGNGQATARFILKVPGEGEGMLDIAQDLSARVDLGTLDAAEVAIEVAVVDRIVDGQDLKYYPLAGGER